VVCPTKSRLCLFTLLVATIIWPEAARAEAPNFMNPIKVAVVGPLTPSSKAFGISHLQGITLAADEYNKEHQADGRSIELQVFDDRADPKAGVRIIESISHSDSVAVLGPANSSVSHAVINRMQTAHLTIPVISSLSSASNLTKDLLTQYFLRANVSDEQRLATLLHLIFEADDKRPRRLLALYEQADAFGEGMLNDTKAWLRTNELSFLNSHFSELPYARDIGKQSAQDLVHHAADTGFGDKDDAILLLGIAQDAVTLVDAIRTQNISSRIYFNEPDALVFKAAAEKGLPIAGIHILSVYWPDNATVNSFKPSFTRTFNDEPSFSAALSYDAARFLFRSIDLAIESHVSGENLNTFRNRVLEYLLKDDVALSVQFLLGGDHRYLNGEYRHLDFQGLQYNSKGTLIRWDEDPNEQPAITLGTGKPIVLPKVVDLALVILFGFLGSIFREFTRTPPAGAWEFLGRLVSPISLVVDPAIALVVFGCLFLLTILSHRAVLEVGGDARLIYNIGSVAFGFVAGFLGVRALFAIIKRLGVDIKEQEILGSSRRSDS
jgi:ABC-type branched-subunit amino acid transport system substrate-binding protein